jgi:hypothetical protein
MNAFGGVTGHGRQDQPFSSGVNIQDSKYYTNNCATEYILHKVFLGSALHQMRLEDCHHSIDIEVENCLNFFHRHRLDYVM